MKGAACQRPENLYLEKGTELIDCSKLPFLTSPLKASNRPLCWSFFFIYIFFLFCLMYSKPILFTSYYFSWPGVLV